jgi:hypothetical protein
VATRAPAAQAARLACVCVSEREVGAATAFTCAISCATSGGGSLPSTPDAVISR